MNPDTPPPCIEVDPKPRYHHGDLPRALVEASTRLIEEGHGSQLSLRAVALAAGVSVAAPYRHFENRESLLAATLAEGFRDLAACTEQARQLAPDPVEALIATGLAYVGFAAKRPHIYRLMFGPECHKTAHPDLMAAGQEALGVLHRAVADGRDMFGITLADVPRVAVAGWTLTHGLASLYVDGLLAGVDTPDQLEAMSREAVRLMINGLLHR